MIALETLLDSYRIFAQSKREATIVGDVNGWVVGLIAAA